MCYLNVRLLCSLTWLCIYQELLGIHAAPNCPSGQRRKYNSEKCEFCIEGLQYQPLPNQDFCKNCLTCDDRKGSEIVSPCTRTTNTICRCRKGFVRRGKDESSCKCEKGSGLVKAGKECHKCPPGTFTSADDSICQKWTACGQRGEKTLGTSVSDAVCNEGPEDLWMSSAPTPSPATTSTTTTATVANSATTSPASTPASTRSPSATRKPINTSYSIELTFYAIGLLLLMPLSALSCVRVVIPGIRNYKRHIIRADMACRKPVEESGDSSRSSLVKSSQGRP
ncbi:hypothetical protein MATL_G00071090 [Megalops atlanticus]|uniref:TNFR-Cys domain-containing protein n=1 Tax=Megalops atlanticus TaxID=7932 RepID=A0A9D3Q8U3_MEGAT|nr:hypothetical protein MATL_G00071090 [Megalops atlanticus]